MGFGSKYSRKIRGKRPSAMQYYNMTNVVSIGFHLQTAKKQETREKRMKEIIEMLAKGEKFH
jgi:uncharacterized protein YdeI (YjbR/CyaY-like superfamily)